jgi:hypothetical protein
MKRKNLILGFLVLLMVLVSGFTYAYWAGTVTGNNDAATGTVTIDEGEVVTTTVVVADETGTNPMVPTAYALANEDTATLTFTIDWDGTGATGATGDLVISIDSYTLGTLTEAEIDAMFSITPQVGVVVTAGTLQTATVTIVFHTEPATEAIYNQVANGTLEINLTFTVTPN